MTHTDCSHPSTPAARRRCRADRKTDIRNAQKMYMQVEESYTFDGRREYEATVDLFSMRWSIDLHAAYDVIERGPVIF